MKKTFVFVMATAMIFVLSACGSGKNKGSENDITPRISITPKITDVPKTTVTPSITATKVPVPTEEVVQKEPSAYSYTLNTDVSIEPTDLYDKDGIKIAATDVTIKENSIDVFLK